MRLLSFSQNGATVHVCGFTGATISSMLTSRKRTYLLLACNDIVPVSRNTLCKPVSATESGCNVCVQSAGESAVLRGGAVCGRHGRCSRSARSWIDGRPRRRPRSAWLPTRQTGSVCTQRQPRTGHQQHALQRSSGRPIR